MKILLGIDSGANTDAVDLIKRLRFRYSALDLAHTVPSFSTIPFASPDMFLLTYNELERMRMNDEAQANILLSAAAAYAGSDKNRHTTHVLHGNPTDSLMEYADETVADLIAVNAAHQPPLLAFLSGSVARGLVVGARQSVLLARSGQTQSGTADDTRPVRAVLATDHSSYMNRCIERLLCFAPLGLEQVTILSCFPALELERLRPYLPHVAVDPAEALRRDLESKNQQLIERLHAATRPMPVTFASRVSGDPVNEAIAHTMQETQSELLIVGAQGHSFLDRLSLGSVSFHQAMTAPYSVLVLRVDDVETAQIRSAAFAGKQLVPA